MSASTAPAPAPTSSVGPRSGSLSRLASWDAAVVVVAILALLVASAVVPDFGTSSNFTFLLNDLLPVAVIALPMTFIIITGEIDLSVASMLGLTSAVMGTLWNQGLTIQAIVPLTIGLGALLGAVNGFFITVLKLPSLPVTIGTLALYRGLAFVVLGDGAVADFPVSYTNAMISPTASGVPRVLLPLLVLALVFALVLHATPFGRSAYAAGANEQAARFSGIRVDRLKLGLYVVSGAVSGLAGVLWTFRYSSARADNGVGLELAVVAAVLLGGVSIFGGKGTLPGVLGGVLLLAVLQNALRLADVSNEALNIVTGVLLIISVLLPNLLGAIQSSVHRRRRRRAPARSAVP